MDISEAKKVVQAIARDKRAALRGGGEDFQGALKRLVGMWSDHTHALIELLQNADDANATVVQFSISSNGIVFGHDGDPFVHNGDKSDIRAICSIDRSTKDPNKHTGFMGVGFKAVFQLSTSPLIVCPPWQFCFSRDESRPEDWGWILVPQWVDSLPTEVGEVPAGNSIFWLPYIAELRSHLPELVERHLLERFDDVCLMFLKNITGIRIDTTERGMRDLSLVGDTVNDNRDGKLTAHRYKVFKKLFPVPEYVKREYSIKDSQRDKAIVREVALAFSIDSNGDLAPRKNSPLYVSLPTDYRTDLRFAVQGDFILDTSRSRIDEQLKWNKWLIGCAATLLQNSIEGFTDDDGNVITGFKADPQMRYQFYRVLPTHDDFVFVTDSRIAYENLAEPVWDYCRENRTIITSSDDWEKPSATVLASSDVQKLMDCGKLKAMTGREHFVHPQVVEVKELLRKLGVEEFPEEKILDALEDETWVNSKDVEWFQDLYDFLWDRLYSDDSVTQTKRWAYWWQKERRLKSLPLVRTSQGTARKQDEVLFPPPNDHEATLAAGIPSILFVDTHFLDGKPRKLLEKLCVQDFSAEGIIRSVILKGFEDGTWQSWTVDQRSTCTRFIQGWLKGLKQPIPAALEKKLGAVRVNTEAGKLERADQCFFSAEGLKLLHPSGNFVVLKPDNGEDRTFLAALGVKDRPRVIVDDEKYAWFSGPRYTKDWNEYFSKQAEQTGYRGTSFGISSVVAFRDWDEITRNESVARLTLSHLITHWESEYRSYTQQKSTYHYSWYGDKTAQTDCYLRWQLLKTAWVPTTKGLRQPSDWVFIPLPEIVRVAGELVGYISIPERFEARNFLHQGRGLFDFLGLRKELDIETLKYLLNLSYVRPIDDKLRQILGRIYRGIGEWLERREEGDVAGIQLLTEQGSFEQAAFLVWNDDHDLGQYFLGAEDVHFAWTPLDMERRYIEILFRKAGVRALSECIQRELRIPARPEPSIDQTEMLRNKARYIYSILKHHKANRRDMAGEQLNNVRVVFSDKLDVLLRLEGVEKIVEVAALYDVNQRVLYRTRQTQDFEIAIELARAFGLDFGLVSDIEMVLREKRDTIEKRFRRQGIVLLDWTPIAPQTVEETLEDTSEAIQPVPVSEKENSQGKGAEHPEEEKSEEGRAQDTLTKRDVEATASAMEETTYSLTAVGDVMIWKQECSPQEVPANVEELQLVKSENQDSDSMNTDNDLQSRYQDSGENRFPDFLAADDKKAIGRWGEEWVLKNLREEFRAKYPEGQEALTEDGFTIHLEGQTIVEVHWLNQNEDGGEGHDIYVIEVDSDQFIEVKSSKTDSKEWFEVSRKQWELARDKGDRFHIYRVVNAGTKRAKAVKITNPIKLWNDGWLEAYPITFRIRA